MWTSKKKVAAASSSLSFPSNLEHKNNESGRRFFGRKSLTGQNKLRHVSEEDAGLGGEDASCSLSATPVSAACNNTNKCRGSRPGWMSAPALTPTPLPLPRVQHDGIRGGDGPQPSTGVFSNFGNLNIRKSSDHFAVASARHQNGFSHVPNGAKDIRNLRVNIPSSSAPATGFSTPSHIRNLRVNIPSRSAPATGFSTPSHSPRQSSTWHFSPSSHSRCHSPIARTQRNSAFAMHNNSPAVCSPVWPEKANFHSLSLPPRETQSQSSSLHPLDTAGEFSVSQWRKGKLIGRGTYGSVYVATNRDTGALCAMKEVDIIPNDPKSAECIKQLEQEIELLSQLEHPNIVKYFGSEIVDDHLYIFLEYVHPGSINRYIRDYCGAITESVVRSFTRHILTGLAYLHSTKTIHRDIKGANLLIDASGVVKLADFGVAKHLNDQACDLSLKPSLDGTRDIWSLGCTIIEMLNGKPPWGELEGPQAMFKVLHKTPTIPEGLSREGKDFLQRCFQRNPADRPSASMLLEHPFLQKPIRISLQDKDKHCSEISGRPKIDQAGILQMGLFLKPERLALSESLQVFPGRHSSHAMLKPQDTSASCHHYPHMIKSYLASMDSPANQAPIFDFGCEQVLSPIPTRDLRFTTMDQPYRYHARNRPEIGFHII